MSSASLPEGSESLYDLLYACQRGQRVAIVGSHSDEDPLRNGLYVPQKEDEHVVDFFQDEYADDGRLLILTGSAGDGKSALLARGYGQADESVPAQRINMDATESRRKDGDYSDRRTAFFDEVVGDMIEEDGPRSAIAINYGLAVDYFQRQNSPDRFKMIWDALEGSQSEPIHQPADSNITVINLSHRRTYDTDPSHLGEGLVRDLIDRFDPTHDESPFTTAYEHEKSNCPAGDDCILQYNVRQLTDSNVKDQLSRLFAGWSIVTGSYLNPRTIIDNIASLLLPTGLQELPEDDVCPVGAAIENGDRDPQPKDLLWNATFQTLGTDIETDASKIDPACYTTFSIDQDAIRWSTNVDDVDGKLPSLSELQFDESVDRVRTLLRQQYLQKESGEIIIDEDIFEEFAATLTFFNNGQPNELQSQALDLLDTTQEALGGWTGRQREDGLVEFVDAKRSTEYRYLSDWENPGFDPDRSEEETKSLTTPGRIKLMAKPPEKMEQLIPIPLSYEMYRLMTQISEGYTPNATDLNQSHAIRVLHSRLEDFTSKRERVVIESRSSDTEIEIKDADLGLRITSEGLE